MMLREFERFGRDKRRFMVREYNGGKYQIYGNELQHICECSTLEMANLISGALESMAYRQEVAAQTLAQPIDNCDDPNYYYNRA